MSKHKKRFNFGRQIIKPLGKVGKEILHTPQNLLKEGVKGISSLGSAFSLPLAIGAGAVGLYLVYNITQKK